MLTRSALVARGAGGAAVVARRHISSSRSALARILLSDATDKVCAEQFIARGHDVDSKPGLSKEELIKIIHEYDGLVVRSATKVTKDILGAASNLKVVGRAGTGVDNIDVPAATMRGVLVVNTPGGNTISTAELTFTHMLALSRNIPQAVASLKAGKWERSKYTGTELNGKTLAIIGLGRIGREVANWARAFGMQTVGFDPVVSAAAARAAGIEPLTLDELWGRADFITLHTPLTKDTRHLINAQTLQKCKKGVRIINCARGGIIDEAALLEALDSGHVAGASLDVYENEPPTAAERPLVDHPKVVASPHLGANTKDAQVRVARDIAVQLSDILEQKDFVGVVNAPNIDFARKSQLLPYVQLAEKIGSLQAQLIGKAKIRRINVTMQGTDVAVSEMSDSIKIAMLKGTLSHLLEQDVNFLNAGPLAGDMGVSVNTVLVQQQDGEHANTIKVEFELDGILNFSRTITGTVFGGNQLRIIDIDGFKVDIPPTGSVVFFNNEDRPGALKPIATVLSKGGCNIAHFSLGRQAKAGKALGAITLDEAVPAPVMEQLGQLKEVSNCSQVQLLDMPDRVFRIHQKGGADASGFVAGDARPHVRPANPQFSSGPTKKRPGYSYAALDTACLGRSHRSKVGKAKLKLAIEESKRLLRLPDDYRLGIVPASDTGAYEMAMWSMLGERPVDIFYWESFGKGWFTDAVSHLGLKESVGVREFSADYGHIPDMGQYDPTHDALFTYNGTTSGARLPDTDWIPDEREGLTFNDATSAAFAMPMAWPKLDVTTYSWQKVLGGEGGHGVLILSPRAVERLERYKPKWPLPKIFRMVKKGKLDEALFEGSTINTPSMLAVEDYLDALAWSDTVGGLDGLVARSVKNYKVIEKFVSENAWIDFLVKDPKIRSTTSVCLSLDLSKDQVKKFTALLEKEGVGLDMGSYRDAPPGLRIWCGATVESEDLEALMPWLSWAYNEVKK